MLFGGDAEVVDFAFGWVFKLMQELRDMQRGRQAKHAEEDKSKSVARLVYWEIAYNALVIDLCRRLMPVRLLASRDEWDRADAAGAITQLLAPQELVVVATPYLELEVIRRLTAEPHPGRLSMRFFGADRDALKGLAMRFRAAEEILRDHLFNDEEQGRLAEAWQRHKPLELKPLSPVDRVASAVSAAPPWVLFALAAWFGLNRLQDIEWAIRPRKQSATERRLRRVVANGLGRRH